MLPDVSPDIAVKFLEYIEYHATVPPRELPKPIATDSLQPLVDEFDWAFLDTTQETLFKLLLVRNTQQLSRSKPSSCHQPLTSSCLSHLLSLH